MYCINFKNIYTFIYQKALLHTLFLLAFKIVESFQCILKYNEIRKNVLESPYLFSMSKTDPIFPFSRQVKSIFNELEIKILAMKSSFVDDLHMLKQKLLKKSQIHN